MAILLPTCILCLAVLLMILALRRFNQPYLVAYILAGVMLKACGLFSNAPQMIDLGELGVVLLMFFLGIEVEIPDKKSLLLQPFIAQMVKMGLSAACSLLLGYLLHWPPGTVLVLSVLLMFNSTAVVSEFLTRNDELKTDTGKIVLNMLLLQDILVAPVSTVLQSMSGTVIQWPKLIASIAGCLILFLLLRSIRNRNMFQWTTGSWLANDHDLQVFLAACICLGCAALGALSGLSAPLGAFAAGCWLGKNTGFTWLIEVLKPFRTFFVGLFFVSIGLRLDPAYLAKDWLSVLGITVAILMTNSLMSAIIFRLLGHTRAKSLEAGALLSQTGELGLLACSIAYKARLIDVNFYNICIAVTCTTLLLSTVWMAVLLKFVIRNFDRKNDIFSA